jgi:hypothetical protein
VDPNITGCDARNEYTDIRCGLPVSVTLANGEEYCEYCATDYIEDSEIVWAIRNFQRAGML